ncbi:MAG: hypothetical protein NTU73_13225 [Ignavibacteriae bacterium]|nr:hypothetical protein [Ignavibacteriota bacterium]
MKKIILILFILIINISKIYTQDYKEATKEEMTHEYIKEFLEINEQKLFEKSMKYIFETTNGKPEYYDKEAGIIIIKGVFTSVDLGDGWASDNIVKYKATMEFKDFKIKISFKNIVLCSGAGSEHMELSNIKVLHKYVKIKFDVIVDEIVKFILINSDF